MTDVATYYNDIAISVDTAVVQYDVSALSSLASRTAVQSANLTSSAITYVRTAGYSTVGDGGGALYKRVSSEPTHEGKVQSVDGSWWELVSDQPISVLMFGAKRDGTNATTAFQNAVDFLAGTQAVSGTILLVPAGLFEVRNLNLYNGVQVIGAGANNTFLICRTDSTIITVSGNFCSVEKMALQGGGLYTTTFGSAVPTLVVAGIENTIRDCRIYGGLYNILASGTDNKFYNVSTASAYGAAHLLSTGSNWYVSCWFDHGDISHAITNTTPYPARANLTAYATVGDVVSYSGYYLQCVVAGSSAASGPTLKNYGQSIIDGTVTWNLVGATNLNAMQFLTGSGENSILSVDMSGIIFDASLSCSSTTANLKITDCTLSDSVSVSAAASVAIRGCTLGNGLIYFSPTFAGNAFVDGNNNVGTMAVYLDAGVSNVAVTNNAALTLITLGAGAGDYNTISGNGATSITNSSTGTHNFVRRATSSITLNRTYNLATASGTQDITGFGFNPKSVQFNYCINGGTLGGVGHAGSDGTQGCSSTTTDSGIVWFRQNSMAIFASNAAGTAYQTGTVSFITDGIRITWAKTGAAAGALAFTVQGQA